MVLSRTSHHLGAHGGGRSVPLSHHRGMRIDFWFDPACPWCWRTSRWLLDVAPHRNLDIRWHSISLLEKNGGAENIPEQYRARVQATHRMLRVVERLLQRHGGNCGTPLRERERPITAFESPPTCRRRSPNTPRSPG